jgi:hypothetical protein
LNLIPQKLASSYFVAEERDTQLADIEEVLTGLDDTYLNKHLVFQIVELIVLRLIPELGEHGVHDLMEQRSVDMHTDSTTQSSLKPGST